MIIYKPLYCPIYIISHIGIFKFARLADHEETTMTDLSTSMDVIWDILPLMFSLMAIGLVFGMLTGVFSKMKF